MKETFVGIDLCPNCLQWCQMWLLEKGLFSKRHYLACGDCQTIAELTAADVFDILAEANKGLVLCQASSDG